MYKKINRTKWGLIGTMLLSFAFAGCETLPFCGVSEDPGNASANSYVK